MRAVGPWERARLPEPEEVQAGVVWPVHPFPGCRLTRALATGLPQRSSDPGPDPAGSGPAEPAEKGDSARQEHLGDGWTPKSHVHLDKATGLGLLGKPQQAP